MPLLRIALTVIVMEQDLMDLPAIAVSIDGVCVNTRGTFDCYCDGTGFDGPTSDSCKNWRCLCQHSG